ncbi:hypothetical protein LEMLEM_LOCUS11428 [Lemmus lemmus]
MGAPGLIPLSQPPPSCPPSDLQPVPRVQLPGELGFLVPKRSQLNQFPPAATGLFAAPAGPGLRDALLDELLAGSFLLNFGTTVFCCFRNQKDRNSYGDVWKMEATTKKIMCKAFFLHVSYCISKNPLPIFYEKNPFLCNCGHYQWCLEIYDLNFSKDFFQCYFNRVNKCR